MMSSLPRSPRAALLGPLLGLFVLGALTGCRSSTDRVQSHLHGRITVESSVDATGEYSGFRVLVVDADGRAVDTLGHAVTEPDGRFEMTVRAPEPGVYPLLLWGREGRRQLGSTDYVVAEGDSGRLRVTLPLNGRRVYVRSDENAALMAYRNTLAQYRRGLVDRLRTNAVDSSALSRGVRQTSSMLWSLQETFPGTVASQLGAVESMALLSGWNDSLVVARGRTIPSSNPRYVEAARIARRAAARRRGQSAALELLDAFQRRARSDAQRAGVMAVRVRTFTDSLQSDAALSAAQSLRNTYPHTRWADWADRAIYEVNNLLPGSEAPNIRMRTLAGDSLSLRDLAGRPVVLEYFAPGNDLFHRQLSLRNALYRGTRADSVAFISISVNPDTLLHEAVRDARALPGRQVIAPEGRDDPLVTAYNVAEVPTRVLIDRKGRLVGRYPGAAFFAFQTALTDLLRTP
jgi:peroxiredoxin